MIVLGSDVDFIAAHDVSARGENDVSTAKSSFSSNYVLAKRYDCLIGLVLFNFELIYSEFL